MIQSFHKLPGGSDTTPRTVLRADGIFEIVLGLVLALGAAASLLDASDFPAPVGAPVVAALGIVLLPVGALLLRLSERPIPGRLLRTLAAANLATAAAAIAWRLSATGFSPAGSALTIASAAVLVVLGAGQLHTAS